MGIGVERKLDGKPKGGKKKSGLPKKAPKKSESSKKVKKTKEEEKKIAEAMRQMRIREAQKQAKKWDMELSDGHRKSIDEKGEPGNRAGRTIEELKKWRRQSQFF